MTTNEIAVRLHELLVLGDSETIYRELFSQNAVAIEPKFEGFERVEGLDNIKKKVQVLVDSIQEVKKRTISPAIVQGANHIAIGIELEALLKNGNTMSLNEVALYEVKDGAIISEQFFY